VTPKCYTAVIRSKPSPSIPHNRHTTSV